MPELADRNDCARLDFSPPQRTSSRSQGLILHVEKLLGFDQTLTSICTLLQITLSSGRVSGLDDARCEFDECLALSEASPVGHH